MRSSKARRLRPRFLMELQSAIAQNLPGPPVLQRYRRRTLWWSRLGLHPEDLPDWPQFEVTTYDRIMAIEINQENAAMRRAPGRRGSRTHCPFATGNRPGH